MFACFDLKVWYCLILSHVVYYAQFFVVYSKQNNSSEWSPPPPIQYDQSAAKQPTGVRLVTMVWNTPQKLGIGLVCHTLQSIQLPNFCFGLRPALVPWWYLANELKKTPLCVWESAILGWPFSAQHLFSSIELNKLYWLNQEKASVICWACAW